MTESIRAWLCGCSCVCAHIWHSFQFHFLCWIKSKLFSNAPPMWGHVGGLSPTAIAIAIATASIESTKQHSSQYAAAGLFLAVFPPFFTVSFFPHFFFFGIFFRLLFAPFAATTCWLTAAATTTISGSRRAEWRKPGWLAGCLAD